jgi:hypothetical protein
MNRNWSEALVRQGSLVWRWGRSVRGAAMVVGVAPATAADVQTLSLGLCKTRILPTTRRSPLTRSPDNTSGKTVNNAVLKVVAPAGTLAGVRLGE